MNRDNEFDDFFRDKLRGFQAQPDEQVWTRIEAELREKKRRRIIPIWWRLSGVAAALLIGVAGYYSFRGEKHHEGPVTESPAVHDSLSSGSGPERKPSRMDAVPLGETVADRPQPSPSTGTVSGTGIGEQAYPVNVATPSDRNAPNGRNDVATAGNESVEKQTIRSPKIYDKGQRSAPVTNRTSLAHHQPDGKKSASGQAVAQTDSRMPRDTGMPTTKLPDNAVIQGKNSAGDEIRQSAIIAGNITGAGTQKDIKDNGVAATFPETKKDSTGLPSVPNTLEELLHEKEKQVTYNEPESNRWQVTTVVAPVYFSSASNGSPLDPRFEKNKKSYTPTLSYGVGAKYAVSKKLAVRAGVHALKLEYGTSDLVFVQSASARKLENVTPNLQGSMIDIENKPLGQQAIMGRSGLSRSVSEYEGQVSQRIGYVEIPMELSYKVIDRKFGVELIGGLSTLILNDNQVVLLSDGLQMPIGEADNLANVHFSSNLGVGLKYNFLKSFQASVEPMLKYQFGTFSDNAGNFKPYFVGLYTGLSYKF